MGADASTLPRASNSAARTGADTTAAARRPKGQAARDQTSQFAAHPKNERDVADAALIQIRKHRTSSGLEGDHIGDIRGDQSAAP